MVHSKKHVVICSTLPSVSHFFLFIPNSIICSSEAYVGQFPKLHRLCYSSVGNEKLSLKELVNTTVGSALLVHLEICIIFHANWKPFIY